VAAVAVAAADSGAGAVAAVIVAAAATVVKPVGNQRTRFRCDLIEASRPGWGRLVFVFV